MSVIQNIGIEQALLATGRVVKAPELSSQQAKAVGQGPGSGGQEYVVKLSGEAVDVANLQEAKNSLHEVARSVRIADQTLQQVNEYVEQMKANLNAIVKQFPPYPPGSEERVSFLRSFNGFRKLIDQLSFGVQDRDAAEILAGENGKINESFPVSAEGNS